MGMAQVIPFKVTDQSLQQKIALLAADSANVTITAHAKQRMRERKILLTQVLDVLVSGIVTESAHQDTKGNWCCTLQKLTSGDRVKIPVAVETLDSGEIVIVITVIK